MPPREEESLIEDMRATIRADRERAAARAPKPPKSPEPPRQAEPEPPVPARSVLRRLLGR
jgi:hypothetical protein